MKEAPYTVTRQEFLATLALHNLFAPTTAAFVSTREDWDLCVEMATGGGCLFTLNCSTTPGGYSLPHCGCQFTTQSYDAPVYAAKLRSQGLEPVFQWTVRDLPVGSNQTVSPCDPGICGATRFFAQSSG